MRSLGACAAILLAVVAIGGREHPAWSETVPFGFTGVVTSIDPDVIGVIGGTSVVDIGDRITGSFTSDLDAPGTTGGTGPGGIVIRTDYFLSVPPGAMSYSVGGLTVTVEAGSEFFVVLVGNGTPSELAQDEVDTFIVGAASSQPTPLESVFRLEDSTQSVFSNTSLPASLDLEAFDRRQFEVNFINPSGFANRLFVTSIDTLALGIAIDIKPRSKLNRINPRRGGVISVAILSTSTFDATTLDPESVVFGPEEAGAIHEQQHIRDANGDGQLDLVLFFKIRKTGIECGDTSASLSGKTFDGEAIQGTDAIRTVGCRRHKHDGRRSDRH